MKTAVEAQDSRLENGEPKIQNLRSIIKRHWALAAALMALWATVGILFSLCIRTERGHFVYAVDDAYIHMAVAKNFAEHGVWGVTPYSFSSSTSSLIWPLLLSATCRVAGPSQLAPLVLNVLFASLALVVVSSMLKSLGVSQGRALGVLLGILFLAPLPAVVFTGMEHSLQIATALPFAYLVAEELAKDRANVPGRNLTSLWGLAAVVTMVRYEGLFMVFAACLLFAARNRWRDSVSLGLAGIAPAVAYGAVSRWKGWFWVPNSIFLKGNVPHFLKPQANATGDYTSFSWWSLSNAYVPGLGVALLTLLALLVYRERKFWQRNTTMIAIVLITAALHLKFAALGWFFRYEAYLIALALFAIAAAGFDYLSRNQERSLGRSRVLVAAAWIVYGVGVPFTVLCLRGANALSQIPQASNNIYKQQYQMGLFLGRYYRGQAVAANDIGAVTYFGDPRLEDLVGLGSLDVAELRAKGPLTAGQISTLTGAAGTKIAVVHADRFKIPGAWKLAGRWTIKDKHSGGDSTVSFFAVDSLEEGRLIANLRQFAASLPSDVVQSGKYTEPDENTMTSDK